MAKTVLSLADALSQFKNQNPDLPEGNFVDESANNEKSPKGSPRLDIVFERKGRAGKQATIVTGFEPDFSDDDLQKLASELKRKLGVGGSARGGEILFQGDQRQKLLTLLKQSGYKARII